ncbi:thiol reductant ABC exporter subunit CydC [Halomonas organivorans]|uniref:ATP-binding cassette subfamily C protein CydC n=1 Tax=Halomonas organivorans TaxID=257772 RepID=A0A7W5G5R7_9GAMM|nr:thiol reductant ABC exporter subunit CydC [Halomonas organivorans]MBB3140691.1 ATP-binding cassette subfamily C protein CydC [Halomonas organivorans]
MAERRGVIATLAPWLRLLGRRRGRLAAGAGLMSLALAAALGLLALSGWFITATGLAGLALAAGAALTLDVYVPGGGIRGFAVTRTVARYLERLYNHDTILRLLADLRGRMFAVLAGLDGRSLAQRRASDWLNRLTADIDTLDSLFLRLLAPAAVALLAILALAGFLALWSPAAGLSVASVLGVAWSWLTWGQARLGLAASRRRIAELERLRGRLIEQLQGLAELETYGSLAARRRHLETIEARLYDDQRRLGHFAALGSALAGLAVGLGWLSALWLGALAWQAGALSGPLMVMMPLAVMALSEALAALPMAFTQFGATLAAAERLNALDDARRDAAPQTGTSLPDGALALSLEEVSLRYPGALSPVFDGFSLALAPGERVAVHGVSGSGKSSLAALATGQLVPDAGAVGLGGLPLADIAAQDLADRVACLTQHTELFDDSLAANLRLAAPEAETSRLWAVLATVELADWAQALPRGLDTRVGEGGRRLSGGQARRLALARLLLRGPGLVILDEPFAGLDSALAARIAERLDAWLAGRSVLYLVHERTTQACLPGVCRWQALANGAEPAFAPPPGIFQDGAKH